MTPEQNRRVMEALIKILENSMATQQTLDNLTTSVTALTTQVTAVQTAISDAATSSSNEIARVQGDLTALRNQLANGQVPDDAALAQIQSNLDSATATLAAQVTAIQQSKAALDAVDLPTPTTEPAPTSDGAIDPAPESTTDTDEDDTNDPPSPNTTATNS